MKKIILLVLIIFIDFNLNAQTDLETVLETVQKSEIEGQIYFLASDELRGRKTGTPEINIAAAYIANEFRKHGVKPADPQNGYYQLIPFEKISLAEKSDLVLDKNSTSDFIFFDRRNISLDKDAIYLGYGMAEDYQNINVKDKVLLLKAGTAEKKDVRSAYRLRSEKMKRAQENGALGIIEFIDADSDLWERLNHAFNEEKLGMQNNSPKDDFTYIWLKKDPTQKRDELFEKDQKISLKVEGVHKEIVYSKNVVGFVEGTDKHLKDEFVIFSAHYDHNGVGKPNVQMDSIYNGARDNAVGTVTVLSAAENIAKYPTKRSALFILFTAEEMGLLGSKWYVEHPVVPLDQSVFCFNSDNGGYNDITKTTIIGLNRTSASNHIIEASKAFGLTAIDDPAPEQDLFDRSDNVHFASKGIPAPTFSMGFNAFDEEINKYYHQVTDNPDSLDYDYLEKFFKSYVLSCRLIANDPKTPFWMEGDKYYEAGKNLFEKIKLAH